MPAVRKPWVTWSLVLVNVGLWLAMVARGASPLSPTSEQLLAWGASSGPAIFENGQLWRLVTGAFVHAAFWHVGVNMASLLSIGPALERRVGRLLFLGIYLASVIVAALASIVVHPASVVVGASGALFGLFAAMTALRMVAPLRLLLALALVAFVPHV